MKVPARRSARLQNQRAEPYCLPEAKKKRVYASAQGVREGTTSGTKKADNEKNEQNQRLLPLEEEKDVPVVPSKPKTYGNSVPARNINGGQAGESPILKKLLKGRKVCPRCTQRRRLFILRPCRHKFCWTCIRSLTKKQCPANNCHYSIVTYCEPHLRGGEAWENQPSDLTESQRLFDEILASEIESRHPKSNIVPRFKPVRCDACILQ